MVDKKANNILFKNLTCPLDGLVLDFFDENGSAKVRCENGHSFDKARLGYINLLSVQDKRSRDPGDTKAMIEARGRVLDSGIYAPIADTLASRVTEKLNVLYRDSCEDSPASKKMFGILDAGCGEGYYLDRCLDNDIELYNINAVGLDISKWAIMAAAKRNKNITWIVASNRNPPIQQHSIDIIICGFGFPDFPAFRQILKPGGFVIMLDPAENHLLELRKIIYPTIKPYKINDFPRALHVDFVLAGQQRLTYIVKVNPQQIKDLLIMSPHLYKTAAEGKEAAFALESLDVTVDVNFTLLAI